MVHYVDSATVDVVAAASPGDDTDITIPADDISQLRYEERAGREVARGTLVLDNAGGKYTLGEGWGEMAWDTDPWGGSPQIDVDDKLRLQVTLSGDANTGGWGGMSWGSDPWGGGGPISLGTAIVTDWSISGATTSTLQYSLDIENYVFNRLSEQLVTEYGELARPISGTEDAHLDTILREYAPDVGAGLLPTIDAEIDYSIDKKSVNKAVEELAAIARDATGTSYVMGSLGEALTLTPVGSGAPLFTADADQTDFEGAIQHSSAADELMNHIRVEGSVDPVAIADEQTTVSGFRTVTATNRLLVRIESRKAELPRIDVYVRQLADSNDVLRVRLHPDDGTNNPAAPAKTESDIISDGEELEADEEGWHTFQLGQHTIAPRARPWLILETNGATGQQVGIDTQSGEPAFKAYFSKPVITELSDDESLSTYRIHDGAMQDDNLLTFAAAREAGRARLNKRSQPKLEFDRQASSRRAHLLNVGDPVNLDKPAYRAEGEYLVTRVSHTYAGTQLSTDLVLQQAGRYV